MESTSIQDSKFTTGERHFYQFLFLLSSKDLEGHLVRQRLVMYALDTVLYVTIALDYTRTKNTPQSCKVTSYHQYTLKHALFPINPFEFIKFI